MIEYVVKHPEDGNPRERWCFVRMKTPPGIPQEIEGEGKYMMWTGQNWYEHTGTFGGAYHDMEDVKYWLEQVKGDKLNQV